MCRFAILRHDGPRGLHWDFLLESDRALKTWALPVLPGPGVETVCEALPDHRLDYLDYEGPVSGDRGTVSRWDRGTYRIRRQSEAEWVVELSGEKLLGRAVLERLPDDPQSWRFSFAARSR